MIDVANPLDFSQGMPPTLSVCNTDSLGEQIQRVFPECRVVKALNTMNCTVMVDPLSIPGDHSAFVCGSYEEAKQDAINLLESFGWPRPRIVDLGDIAASRGMEMYVTLWLRLYGAVGGPRLQHRDRARGLTPDVRGWPSVLRARRRRGA